MSAVLELLPIEAEASAPAVAKTDVAVAASAALDLAKIDLTDVALAQFGKWRDQVAAAEKQVTGVVFDVNTKTKLEEVKSLRWRLIGQPRADARKVSKDLKSKLAKVSKAIGAEEEAAVAEWDRVEAIISPVITKREAEFEEEAQRELDRKARHGAGVAKIRSYAELAQGLPSARIAAGIEQLKAMTFGEEWEEFAERAATAQRETLSALHTLLATTQAKEVAEAETKRQAEVQQLLAGLTKHVTDCFGKTSDFISLRVDLLASHVYSESVAAEVLTAHEAALQQLRTMHTMAVQQEAMAAQLAAQLAAQAPAPVALPAAEPNTTPQGSQQVLKAEAETPDATDRDTPAISSPSVGSMGAGQPADAGPAGDDRSIETSEADAIEPVGLVVVQPADRYLLSPGHPNTRLLSDCLAFVRHAEAAFTGTKFPTQPKPSVEWWAELRAGAEALAMRLVDAGAAS